MISPVFELVEVSRYFGNTPALLNINLCVQTGERVAVVGPSGAGKSTLISLLNGTLMPSQGSVLVLGKDLAGLDSRALRRVQGHVGTIYQQFHLVDNLRVIHNVNAGHLSQWSFAKSLFSLVWPLDVNTASQALRQVGIPEKIHERTDQLSGGQQQRVAIARVLVQNPKAILADEPISSLDPERSREILDLLVDLNLKTGKTFIASLHTIDFALSHFQRIIGLRHGMINFDLPAKEVGQEIISKLYRINA